MQADLTHLDDNHRLTFKALKRILAEKLPITEIEIISVIQEDNAVEATDAEKIGDIITSRCVQRSYRGKHWLELIIEDDLPEMVSEITRYVATAIEEDHNRAIRLIENMK